MRNTWGNEKYGKSVARGRWGTERGNEAKGGVRESEVGVPIAKRGRIGVRKSG